MRGGCARRRRSGIRRRRCTQSGVRNGGIPAAGEEVDDTHKAQIPAHVERSVPPITPDGRQAIELGLRARLAIKHVFPPRLPQRSMSYFGGLAIVPQNFDWPTLHNRKGLLERLTFLAQIDCSDLPTSPAIAAGAQSMAGDRGHPRRRRRTDRSGRCFAHWL